MTDQNQLPQTIKTRRLTLRPPTDSDAEPLREAVTSSYAELHRWMIWARDSYTTESALAFCRDAQEKYTRGREYPALVVLNETAEVIGSAGLMATDQEVPSYEIGYWIKTSHAGHGYVTEAAHSLAVFAFETLGAKRVSLRIDELNTKSIKVAQRLGFQLEATLRAVARDNLGNLANFRIYSVFNRSELIDLNS